VRSVEDRETAGVLVGRDTEAHLSNGRDLSVLDHNILVRPAGPPVQSMISHVGEGQTCFPHSNGRTLGTAERAFRTWGFLLCGH